MTYSIIGTGRVGKALAGQFARNGISIGVANSRGKEAAASALAEYGEVIRPLDLRDAVSADVILLAIPFWSHIDVAKAAADWNGRIVIDATNAYGVPLADLGDEPSSVVIAKSMPGARLVKAFNHLPTHLLGQDPRTAEGRRVIFLSGDDNAAVSAVSDIVGRLGFASVSLGRLAEGGRLVQAQDRNWAPLIFQVLLKREG